MVDGQCYESILFRTSTDAVIGKFVTSSAKGTDGPNWDDIT